MATKRTSKPTTDEVENKTTETAQEAEKSDFDGYC